MDKNNQIRERLTSASFYLLRALVYVLAGLIVLSVILIGASIVGSIIAAIVIYILAAALVYGTIQLVKFVFYLITRPGSWIYRWLKAEKDSEES